jgi:choline dehydrogenase-like flavoprotein
MHIDARNIENNSLIEGDICIVGSGAAGISMALEWLNTPYKVILLEGGGFEYEQPMQDLYKGKTTGQRYYPLDSARLHYFGGTTGHWAGFCSTFDPIDFKERDWVPHSGWPIKREDLDPYYARAHKNLDLGPYDYNVKHWQDKDPELVPLPLDDKVVYNKMWQFSPPTRFGTKYRDTIVKAPNIHLYTYANVTDITANENASAIKEVTVKNLAGKNHTVRAKQFIIACCSIQNARLLLASNKQAPKGLGNQNDNVGRYFMEHLEIKSAEMWLTKPDALKLYQWNWGVKQRAELAISEDLQRKYRILNGTASLMPLEIAKSQKPMIDLWSADTAKTNAIMREADKKDKTQKQFKSYKAFELFTRIEQAPNPNSRVTLDTEKDALGVPRAMLHWELTPLEKHSLRGIYKIIGEQMGISAAGRVRLMDYLQDESDNTWPSFTGGGWHHMGTTRMSDDPKKGVVDANCKVHGVANLYMAGASSYVTAAAPNPTLTLVALTIRLADHIKQKVKSMA